MNVRTRLALMVMLLATLATVANLGLALLDSPLTRGRLFAMLCAGIIMAAAVVVTIGSVRALKVTRAVWRVDTAIPLEAAKERRRELRRGASIWPFMVHILVMLAMLVAMMSLVLLGQARVWGALRVRGSETTGTITDKREYPGRYTSHDYLHYEFRHGILTIPGSARVSRQRWRAAAVGDATPVTYLANAPSYSLPVPQRAMSLFDVFSVEGTVMFAVIVLLFAVFVLLVRRMLAANMRLLRDGEPALARVTEVANGRVHFTFDTPSGAVQSHFLDRSLPPLRPAPGDTFALLYDPRKPKWTWPWFRVRARCGLETGAPKPSAGIVAREVLQSSTLTAVAGAPARVRLTWQAPLVLAIMLVMSGPMILRFVESLSIHRRLARLTQEGAETRGVVVHTFATHEPSNAKHVRYRYSIGSRSYEARFAATSTRLQGRLIEGGATVVTYAASDPTISLPVPKRALDAVASEIAFELPASIVFLSFVAALAIALLVFVVREWRLARDGRITLAEVLETKEILILRRCRYKFVAGHGDVEQRAILQGTKVHLAAGDQIEVIYTAAPLRSRPLADLVLVRRG